MTPIRMTWSAVAAAVAVFAAASASAAQRLPASAAERADSVFIELAGVPTTEGGRLESLREEKAALRKAIAKAGIQIKERRAFDVLFNGLSVDISPADVARLSHLPGVKAVYPVVTIPAPRRISREDILRAVREVREARGPRAESPLPPTVASMLAMTGADRAQSELGLSGAGVKVGVIDTGIDIDHPDFGGSGVPGTTAFPTARVAYGYDFVGDDYNADPTSPFYSPVPVPDANPDDCGGHGTHVAGTVGANGLVKGVAPNVTLGAYRVFGCAGSSAADVIIAAMERALADGMDVVNQSLGASFQWPQYPTAKAADRLVKAGVTMVASAGNNGAFGVYSGGAPGVGEFVIGVASFDNTTVDLRSFGLSTGGSPIGYTEAGGGPASPTSGSAPLARTGTTASLDDACFPLAAGSLSGAVALVRRGGCSFYQKAFNAQSAGATGVILYNNVPGLLFASVVGSPAISVPVVSVAAADGALIDAQIQAGAVSVNWSPDIGNFANPTGGLISSFSSYGLSPTLALKPNLGAPGGSILSTYPLDFGGYAVLSGTSMASPNVAGTAALMLEARPRLRPAEIKVLLQNGADPKLWSLNAATGLVDNVHRQGAGLIDVMQSVKARSRVVPSELSLGESQAGPATRTLTLRNSSRESITYTLGHTGAVATLFTYVPAFYSSAASVSYSAATVTVPAQGSATVDVTITAPASLPDGGVYGGHLVFTEAVEGGQTLRVPYAGFKGNYQSLAVLTSGGNGFPWLSQLVDGFFNNRPDGATYTMADGDIPYVLLHLDHPSRQVKLTAVDSRTGRTVGEISNSQYVARNSTSTGFFAFSWDGTVNANGFEVTVPNGAYTVKVSVLKALGNASNPADWETWSSSTVTLARP